MTSPSMKPLTSVPSTKARRRMVMETPNCSARPAHTPAIILPSRARYQVRVSALPGSRRLPHQRHFTASARISSAQYGQRLVPTSGMALLAAQAYLMLDEDRDGGVGEREQEGERRGVVEREVGAERRGQDRSQEREGGANQVEVQEEDRRQRQQRGREREGERRPGGPARVAGEERLGGGEQPPREPQRRCGDGRRGELPHHVLDGRTLRAAARARGQVGRRVAVERAAEEERRERVVAVGHDRAVSSKRRMAWWRRLFTVPRGQPRMAATSSSERSW